MATNLEDAILAVIDKPSPESLSALKQTVAASPSGETAEQLEMLWEEWENRKLSVPEAKFILEIAALGVPNQPYLRKMMIAAVKTILPPFISQAPVIKASGVRDDARTPADIAARVERLIALRSGSIVFLESSRRWGVAGTIDAMNASLPMTPFAQVGSNAAVPLEVVLKDAAVLSSGPDVSRLVTANGMIVSASIFRATVAKRKQTAIPESRIKLMARTGCCRRMDDAAFEQYWSAAPVQPAGTAPANPASRRGCDGRTLAEMQLLLLKEQELNAGKFSDDEVAAVRNFFTALPASIAMRDVKLMAEVLALVFARTPAAALKPLFAALEGKVAFFPKDPAAAPIQAFQAWGEISSKLLTSLCAGAAAIFPEDYLAALAMRLPLKALNSLGPCISVDAMIASLNTHRGCSADLLLWIWKNRKKHRSDELLELVNLDNVSRILSSEDPPKTYLPARRELHALLLDNWDFQSHLITMAGDPGVFGAILQGALFLDAGERQSLMVKLARQSQDIQNYLESGAGRKILEAGTAKGESADAPVYEASYTSVKSHQMLIRELDDIINIHIPENRDALAAARAHGDFRENSEFDAAKERKRHLNRRRGELERELGNIQPVMMAQVQVTDTAVIGSAVEIASPDGKTEKYFLLGAWDGDPERRFLSYRTRLGKAIRNCRVGETFTGADGKPWKLLSVAKLPDDLIAELDNGASE